MSSVSRSDSAGPPQPNPLVDYFRASRGPWLSFLFALPILAIYELLEWSFHPDWVNGADALLTRLMGAVDARTRFQILLGLLVISGLLCWRVEAARRREQGGRTRAWYFLGMFGESLVYALFFGAGVNHIMQLVLPERLLQLAPAGGGVVYRFTMAMGAGIYEELLFRVLLMGGLMLLLTRVAKVESVLAWVLAAVASSAVFSAFHYIGPGADALTLQSFVFRFIAGGLLATLYGLRGFGVAVWTHALYDLLVMLLGAGA